MDNFLSLVLLALSMFLITMGLGLLPSKIKTSKYYLDLISIFGAGLLVGAALIIIVPEGMVVLVEAVVNKKLEEKS